jgi:Fur family transcriptional regulator, ferric uptake regulator
VTPARRAVLSALEAAIEPLSAAGVLLKIGGACDQATVYRALEHLEGAELAESFIAHCDAHGTERYWTASAKPHRHWFHCESCHRFIDAGPCRLGPLMSRLGAESGLEVRRHALYFSGLCKACRGKGSAA